jgi:hypothetical protein
MRKVDSVLALRNGSFWVSDPVSHSFSRLDLGMTSRFTNAPLNLLFPWPRELHGTAICRRSNFLLCNSAYRFVRF